MTNTDDWRPEPCTLVAVTHEWTSDRFDHAGGGGLDLLLEFSRTLDGWELEVLSAGMKYEGFPLSERAGTSEHRVRSVDPNAVQRIVATIRRLVADLPNDVVEVQRRNRDNEEFILLAIQRGLGQAPPE